LPDAGPPAVPDVQRVRSLVWVGGAIALVVVVLAAVFVFRDDAGSTAASETPGTGDARVTSTTRGAATATPTTSARAIPPTTTTQPADDFVFGVTHTQFSADSWQPRRAVARATDVLRDLAPLQNQHLMGWGADNPEPSPDDYNWASLDARVQLMRDTGARMVLTLCCAPDWMKGGEAGTTNWATLEVAPDAAHYDDFADLAAAAAIRYPDILYFQVWNELKGFYDPVANTWRADDYTQLYNAVYTAVKAVRPDAKIGGPYVVVDSWSSASVFGTPSSLTGSFGVIDQRALDVLEYWLAHNVGADFVSVDARTTTKDEVSPADPKAALAKFAVIDTWLRARTPLPIWWSEFYVDPGRTTSPAAQAELIIDALETMRTSGAAAALLWSPNGDGSTCNGCLFSDVRDSDGGRRSLLGDLIEKWNGNR
jgi:hypothetical protein